MALLNPSRTRPSDRGRSRRRQDRDWKAVVREAISDECQAAFLLIARQSRMTKNLYEVELADGVGDLARQVLRPEDQSRLGLRLAPEGGTIGLGVAA